MCRLSLELIFVTVLLTQRGCAQSATASVSPLAVNASQGSVTTFHCSVTGAVALLWRVDNIVLSGMNRLIDRGITFSEPVEESPGSFQSNLTMPATPENDGSVVQCLALVVVGTNMISPNATYRVQGMGKKFPYISIPIIQRQSFSTGILDPPSNLTIVTQGASHRRLFWEAPESLDITDIEPDISNYRICTNFSGVCINTTELEYIFPNVRITIEFSVTAINVVGESNASIAIYEPCDPTTGKKNMNAKASNF